MSPAHFLYKCRMTQVTWLDQIRSQREQCGHKRLPLHSASLEGINEVNRASLFCILDEGIKNCIKPRHVHIDSLLAYFFLNYVLNGNQWGDHISLTQII